MKLVHEFNTSIFELYDLETDISESNNLIDGNETLYAEMIRDMYTKMKALGPCPNDKVSPFILSGGENGGQLTKCSWFSNNKERCEHHVEGRLFCPSACASRISKKMCNREKYPPILPGSPPCNVHSGQGESAEPTSTSMEPSDSLNPTVPPTRRKVSTSPLPTWVPVKLPTPKPTPFLTSAPSVHSGQGESAQPTSTRMELSETLNPNVLPTINVSTSPLPTWVPVNLTTPKPTPFLTSAPNVHSGQGESAEPTSTPMEPSETLNPNVLPTRNIQQRTRKTRFPVFLFQ